MNSNRVKWNTTTANAGVGNSWIPPSGSPQTNEYRSMITDVFATTEPEDWRRTDLMVDILQAPQGADDFAKYIPLDRYETQLFANNFTYSPVCLTNSYNSIYSGNQLNGIFAGNFCN